VRRLPAAALVTAASLLVVAAPAAAASAASSGTATVSVLHGVPGLPVDVYVDGQKLLSGFTPGTLTDPTSLPAGSHDLAVFPAGADPSGQPAIKADGVQVPAGANVTVVAHLDAGGTPVLTPYVNDTSAVPAGKARLVVRHDAAAPAVDVRAGGTPVLTGLTNPREASAVVPAGTVSADVVATGTTTPVLGPTDLTLGAGTSTIVYAYGSLQDKSLALATQTIDGLGGAPGGVGAGTGGQAADAVPTWVLATSGATLLGAAVVGAPLVRRRRTAA
jgi:Domain of unknown function (DUF4397)